MWIINSLKSEDDLKPGDTIFISRVNTPYQGITHFAIYIGYGLYLSKFGNLGRLIVTSLNEMKKGFGGNFVFSAIPVRTQNQIYNSVVTNVASPIL